MSWLLKWVMRAEIARAQFTTPGAGPSNPGAGVTNPGAGPTTPGAGPVDITINNPLSCGDVVCILQQVYRVLFAVAIPITALMVLVGAFQLLTSGGNKDKVAQGKQTILYAAIGFAAVLLASSVSYVISDFLGTAPPTP